MSFPLSRFHATPEEIHTFLADHLAEDSYLRYQQRIGAAAVRKAADDLRAQADQQQARAQESGPLGGDSGADDLRALAESIDPDQADAVWPSVLVRHFGHPTVMPKQPLIARGALRAHGRCEERARRGDRFGVRDRPLDSMGRCTHAGEHDEEYRLCGADLGRDQEPYTCNRRVAHGGGVQPGFRWCSGGVGEGSRVSGGPLVRGLVGAVMVLGGAAILLMGIVSILGAGVLIGCGLGLCMGG